MPATDRNGVAITNPATQDAYLAVQSANITRIKGVEDDDMPTNPKTPHNMARPLRAQHAESPNTTKPDTDTTASPTASPNKCAPSPNR